ncbi:MAG TPA: hypothetical protein VJT10_20825 [Steroidobacteraceae bacterium]|nr:hypothetical protein [Steroidobacteraceae bacterium]
MTTTLAGSVVPRPAVKAKRVFVPLAVLAAVMAFVGFWPTYFGPVLAGTDRHGLLIHLHAAVFVTWLALFTAQAALAATGRIAQHIRLGPWLFAFGVLLILMGLAVAFGRFGEEVVAGNLATAQGKLFAPLRDMIVFTPFLAAGWIYRRRPEIHKRCMLVATTILLVAAVSRMKFLGAPPPNPLYLLVWPLPIYIAMVHDYAAKRLTHPVYVIGVLAMVGMRLVAPLRGTQTWLDLTAWLATLYH